MNPVPKSIASISKELIKLHIDVDDIVSFNGFGPWMKPAGFEPPQLPIEKPKKKKRKEPTTLPLAKDKKEPVEGKCFEDYKCNLFVHKRESLFLKTDLSLVET